MKQINDFGRAYTETNLEAFPVEPFATYTNIGFLIIVLYWWYQRRQLSDKALQKYLDFCLPLLFIGFLGGTVYHATRSHSIWLLMDFVPIYLLCLITAFYHWQLLIQSWWKSSLILLGLGLLPQLVMRAIVVDRNVATSFGYVLIAIPLLLPLVVDELKTGFTRWRVLLLGLLTFGLAIGFRVADSSPWVVTHLEYGTHGLWHIFGSLTSHILMLFMSKRPQIQLSDADSE